MFSNLCEPWPHVWCGDITGINPEVTGHAAMAATEILWQATGRRFGNCAVPVRPCRQDCSSNWPQDLYWSNGILSRPSWGWPWPALMDGVWLNLSCGVCNGACSCNSFSEVLLEERINNVVSMTVDGVSLTSPQDYVIYNGQRLVKAEGEWPRCQDWHVTGGPGTWVIDATFGSAVPELGQLAMGALIIEIAKLCSGEECNLPPSVQRVVRQGVTMERISAKELLDNNLTGLYLPDQFIRTYNPSGLKDRARAYSPDRMPTRRQR